MWIREKTMDAAQYALPLHDADVPSDCRPTTIGPMLISDAAVTTRQNGF